jgi:hypothetical protein
MFLLNNIHDRNYDRVFPGLRNVRFDLSEVQISNAKNSDWQKITPGSIACVVNSTRKISTFYLIESREPTNEVEDSSRLHVITGVVVGKLPDEPEMTTLLNRYAVRHPELPNNQFSIGFNVADLGDQLDKLKVTAHGQVLTLGELKRKLAR